MNHLEKKSFYSFLILYLFTSLLAVLSIGYLYYVAQKSNLESETYYKLEHIVDRVAGSIILAHMKKSAMEPIKIPPDMELALISSDGRVVEGRLTSKEIPTKVGYFQKDGYTIIISDASHEHMNIRYIVVKSNRLVKQLRELQSTIWRLIMLASLIIIVVAWRLSRLFMEPIRERIVQIESFINDMTHELNTPITSLLMSSSQALKQDQYNPRIVKNISISTRQLLDIYRSLTYLSFSNKEESIEIVDLQEFLKKNIDYYRPLAEIKYIDFETLQEQTMFKISHTEAMLLFGNLIGNAIKYSSPRSTIVISLKKRILTIKDQGIGIDPKRQKEIFKKFQRGTDYSGGFGVGLTIVKNICEKYTIRIALDSALGKSTEFRLYFAESTGHNKKSAQ